MKDIEIKTLTPVHIGSGKEFTFNSEFLLKGNNVGIIDEKKVLSLIGEENVATWVAIIEKEESLLDYLEKRMKGDLKLESVCKYTMRIENVTKSNIQTLKEQMHNGMGQVIIPGSSIKGAIRTAILNTNLAAINKNWRENEITTPRGKITDKKIQQRIFGNDPNHDFMRFVKVGDVLFQNNDLKVVPTLSMNYFENRERTKRDSKFFQLLEAISPNKKTIFRMKLDLDLWNQNISKNVMANAIPDFLESHEKLLKTINNFTKSLLQKEIDFWSDDDDLPVVEDYIENCHDMLSVCNQCKAGEAILRIGHGSGWIFMTGSWIKNENYISDPLYDKIVDKTRPKNYRYKDYFFPKTRRMLNDGSLLGFVKLSCRE